MSRHGKPDGNDPAQQMAGGERRQHARYRIPQTSANPEALTVGISLLRKGIRHDLVGLLLDVSGSGFSTRLHGPFPALGPEAEGEAIDWEIHSPLGPLAGQGRIRRVQTHGNDLLLGLHVGGAARSSQAVLQPLVDYLRHHWNLGSISFNTTGKAQVYGRLHFDTARQLIHLTRRVNQIDLSRCSGVDGAGIGVIDLAVSRGVALSGCQGDLASIMSVTGICGRCRKLRGVPDSKV